MADDPDENGNGVQETGITGVKPPEGGSITVGGETFTEEKEFDEPRTDFGDDDGGSGGGSSGGGSGDDGGGQDVIAEVEDRLQDVRVEAGKAQDLAQEDPDQRVRLGGDVMTAEEAADELGQRQNELKQTRQKLRTAATSENIQAQVVDGEVMTVAQVEGPSMPEERPERLGGDPDPVNVREQPVIDANQGRDMSGGPGPTSRDLGTDPSEAITPADRRIGQLREREEELQQRQERLDRLQDQALSQLEEVREMDPDRVVELGGREMTAEEAVNELETREMDIRASREALTSAEQRREQQLEDLDRQEFNERVQERERAERLQEAGTRELGREYLTGLVGSNVAAVADLAGADVDVDEQIRETRQVGTELQRNLEQDFRDIIQRREVADVEGGTAPVGQAGGQDVFDPAVFGEPVQAEEVREVEGRAEEWLAGSVVGLPEVSASAVPFVAAGVQDPEETAERTERGLELQAEAAREDPVGFLGQAATDIAITAAIPSPLARGVGRRLRGTRVADDAADAAARLEGSGQDLIVRRNVPDPEDVPALERTPLEDPGVREGDIGTEPVRERVRTLNEDVGSGLEVEMGRRIEQVDQDQVLVGEPRPRETDIEPRPGEEPVTGRTRGLDPDDRLFQARQELEDEAAGMTLTRAEAQVLRERRGREFALNPERMDTGMMDVIPIDPEAEPSGLDVRMGPVELRIDDLEPGARTRRGELRLQRPQLRRDAIDLPVEVRRVDTEPDLDLPTIERRPRRRVDLDRDSLRRAARDLDSDVFTVFGSRVGERPDDRLDERDQLREREGQREDAGLALRERQDLDLEQRQDIDVIGGPGPGPGPVEPVRTPEPRRRDPDRRPRTRARAGFLFPDDEEDDERPREPAEVEREQRGQFAPSLEGLAFGLRSDVEPGSDPVLTGLEPRGVPGSGGKERGQRDDRERILGDGPRDDGGDRDQDREDQRGLIF
jgi:hypothetical protein